MKIPFFLFCAVVPLLTQAATLADRLGDAGMWRAMDWAHASASPVWNEHSWVDYLGEQPGNEHRSRIQRVMLAGGEWHAILSQQGPEARLTLYTTQDDATRNQCHALYQWGLQHFGAPARTTDASYRLAGRPLHIDKHVQWDLGQTRVTEDCQGQQENRFQFVIATLHFDSGRAPSELQALQSWRCSRQLRTAGSHAAHPLNEMSVIVDAGANTLRRSDNVPIRTRNLTLVGDPIRFSLQQGDTVNDYRIEKTTGALEGTLWQHGAQQAEVSGQCHQQSVTPAQP
ncbi:hypothetical protein [Paludibacterium yongneupense]|uniref:hypothetical protein n=1 Tax=Paludibacterium yongneupense TaxID=400061 RepID=UPI00040D1AC3|nr:hypothetical protein [Paludibacterium yongneupense]